MSDQKPKSKYDQVMHVPMPFDRAIGKLAKPVSTPKAKKKPKKRR